MKALVYHGVGEKRWEDKPDPTLQQPTDAIVRILHTTICGTDLHILKGDVPTVTPGRTLGHEGVGVVEAVGEAVSNFRPGDRVLISCITSCGRCPACKKQFYSHCSDGGWILGHLIDGTQAEKVRIPHADQSLYAIPPSITNEEVLVMLSDVFPTSFEIGVLNGHVRPGDTVAIVGAGPIGMGALLGCRLFSPSRLIMVDVDDNRLESARQYGATDGVNPRTHNAVDQIMGLTDGKGVDVAIEAVGVPETFDICQRIVTPGGHIAVIGVFGTSVNLEMQRLWSANITLTTGLVNTNTIASLLRMVQSGMLNPGPLITHRFHLQEMMEAYRVFAHASQERALKLLISA
ncbi:MAG: zinc-dependent alcohol dehydrogenase family protein [Fimbriimonadales bacterium]